MTNAVYSFLGAFLVLVVVFGLIGGTSAREVLIAVVLAALVGGRVYLRDR